MYAAAFAAEGLTGIEDIFDLEYGGYPTTYSHKSSFDLAKLVKKRSGRRRLTGRPVGGIWVVPVSAIGPDFARMASDGIVRKLGRGRPQPRNISVPLTTGLVDVSRLELDNHKKTTRKAGGFRPEDIVKDVVESCPEVDLHVDTTEASAPQIVTDGPASPMACPEQPAIGDAAPA